MSTTKLPDAFYSSRLLSRKQIQEFLGIKSKKKFYALMNRKVDPLPTVKLGGSRKGQLDKIMWWVEKQAE